MATRFTQQEGQAAMAWKHRQTSMTDFCTGARFQQLPSVQGLSWPQLYHRIALVLSTGKEAVVSASTFMRLDYPYAGHLRMVDVLLE